MCGAYGFSVMNVNDIYDRFDIENTLENYKPRCNIRLGKLNSVIVNQEKKKIEFMLWGLLPHFFEN